LKKNLIITGIILFLCSLIFILSGCGALLTALIQAILGTKLGFIAIPAIAAAKINAAQEDKLPGMIILPHNNPPPGYSMAPGAIVSIEGYNGTVTTDESGFFRFDEVPVGIRKLKVEHPNFISLQQEVVVTEEGSENRPFSGFKIVPEGPVTLSLLKDTIQIPQADYYFETYGLDPNNVAMRPSATWSVNSTHATIDPNGVFRTTEVGRYTVTATSTLDPSISDTIEITVVEQSLVLQGKVTNISGTPLPGAEVTVKETNLLTETNSEGNYILRGVPATTVITVNAKVLRGEGSTTVTVEDFTQPVTVDIVIHYLSLTPGTIPTAVAGKGNITGKTYETDPNSPLINSFVAFYTLNPSSSYFTGQASPDATAISDINGIYTFTDVPAGPCRLEFWRNEADYNSMPDKPLGAVNETVVAGETKTIDIPAGVVPAPTPLPPTPAPTPTPTPGWHIINNTVNSNNLFGVHFINETTGWFTGSYGTIIKTITGGTALEDQSDPNCGEIYGVYFLDTNTGLIAASDPNAYAAIFRTISGGSSWLSVYTAPSPGTHMYGIDFPSSTDGWAAGDNGITARSSDSGINWDPNTYGIPIFYDISFVSGDMGWAATDSSYIYYYNEGSGWMTQGVSLPAINSYRGVHFVDSGNGWVAGFATSSTGVMVHTSTGGTSWDVQTLPTGTGKLNDVYFIDINTGWACGDGGTIVHTENGGSSWQRQNTGVSDNLQGIYFVNINNGWAVGDNGRILKFSY